jgi:IS5 family transposase
VSGTLPAPERAALVVGRRLRLVVRTVGLARAKTKLGLANLAQNLLRFVWFEVRAAPA